MGEPAIRRWIVYASILVVTAVWNVIGFAGTDVGKLKPVQVVYVIRDGNMVKIQTDTEDIGIGANPEAALGDMKQYANGIVFLETADYLILQSGSEMLLQELREIFRPSCRLCVASGQVDLQKVAAYLSVHEPTLTLQEWISGGGKIPEIREREGQYHLVP